MKTSRKGPLNFLQLGCILGSGLGVPGMIIGGQLLKKYGPEIAIAAILIGNIFLWIIGISIAVMNEKKNNAIQNVKSYLGGSTGFIAALIFIVSFLFWYSIQVEEAALVIGSFYPSLDVLKIGIGIGFITAVISIWQIKIIQNFCVAAFPFLFLVLLYRLITSTQPVSYQLTINFLGNTGFSLYEAILSVMIVWLPFSVNLPTVTRHAISKADTVLAISLKTGFLIFFQMSSIFLNADTSIGLVNRLMPFASEMNMAISLLFVLSSYICVNLLNIYFSDAGWEAIFPRYQNKSRYFVIGAIGTFVYFIAQKFDTSFNTINSFHVAEFILTSFICNLGFVMILDILVRLCVNRIDKKFLKTMSAFCWGLGCVTSIYLGVFERAPFVDVYYKSAFVCFLVFLIAAFVTQSVVSCKRLISEV